MKAAIVLCLIMGFCELAVAGFARKKEKNKRLDELRVAITDVLFNVEQHTTTNTDQLINMQLFLRFTRHNFTKTFHTELSAEMNNIRAGVDAALAEGRHAAYCFEDAENARKKIQRVIEDGAYSCTNTSLYDFLHRLSIFVKIAEKGKKMVRQIRSTIAACDSVMYDKIFCASDWPNKYKEHAEEFITMYPLFSEYRLHIARDIANKTLLCLQTLKTKGLEKIKEMKFRNQSCVDGAE